MKYFLFAAFLSIQSVHAQTKYEQDFAELWNDIHLNHAYLNKQKIDWEKVGLIYTAEVKKINTDTEFIRFLEIVLNELHNGHVSLNTNLHDSNRIIPSGSDIFAVYEKEKCVIVDLRTDFGAQNCGLKPGMEVVKFNGIPVRDQISNFLPRYTSDYNQAMYSYAINMLLAGTHDKKRVVTVLENGREKDFYPDSLVPILRENLMEVKKLDSNTAYIKINNCLWNNDLISEFDLAVDRFLATKKLVLDLTETASGGNTTVARAIMGRFTDKRIPYQQHEYDEFPYETKRQWVEYVLPRGTCYRGKIFVLVGHWTGSMGEGLALGFSQIKKATVIGSKMAGLIGSVSSFETSNTHIGFQIPTERIYDINGNPREDYLPEVLTQNGSETWQMLKKMTKLK